MFITKQMQTELALTSFQPMKVFGDSGLHLFEQNAENLIVGYRFGSHLQ